MFLALLCLQLDWIAWKLDVYYEIGNLMIILFHPPYLDDLYQDNVLKLNVNDRLAF